MDVLEHDDADDDDLDNDKDEAQDDDDDEFAYLFEQAEITNQPLLSSSESGTYNDDNDNDIGDMFSTVGSERQAKIETLIAEQSSTALLGPSSLFNYFPRHGNQGCLQSFPVHTLSTERCHTADRWTAVDTTKEYQHALVKHWRTVPLARRLSNYLYLDATMLEACLTKNGDSNALLDLQNFLTIAIPTFKKGKLTYDKDNKAYEAFVLGNFKNTQSWLGIPRFLGLSYFSLPPSLYEQWDELGDLYDQYKRLAVENASLRLFVSKTDSEMTNPAQATGLWELYTNNKKKRLYHERDDDNDDDDDDNHKNEPPLKRARSPVCAEQEISGFCTFVKHIRPRDIIQQRAIASFFQHVHPRFGGGGVLALPCNFGKTFVMLYILHILFRLLPKNTRQQRVVWMTHTRELAKQVRDEAQRYFPKLRIVLVGGGSSWNSTKVYKQASSTKRAEIDEQHWDGEFIIVLVQKIARIPEIPPRILNQVLMVIMDECHHVPATMFLTALLRFRPMFTVGLSATPTRRDGLSTLLHMFVGPILYAHFPRATRVPTTSIFLRQPLSFFCKVTCPDAEGLDPTKEFQMHKLRAQVARELSRASAALDVAVRHALAFPQQQIVVFCDFVWQCKALVQCLNTVFPSEETLHVRSYYGALNDKARAEVLQNGVIIVSTREMMKEGLSLPRLAVAIFCTVTSDIEQMFGRAGRSADLDHALVVDFEDDHPKLRNIQFFHRKQFKDHHHFHRKPVDYLDGNAHIRFKSTPEKKDMPLTTKFLNPLARPMLVQLQQAVKHIIPTVAEADLKEKQERQKQARYRQYLKRKHGGKLPDFYLTQRKKQQAEKRSQAKQAKQAARV